MSNNGRQDWSAPQAQLPQGQENANTSVNAFRQTQQQLFGVYPLASATPSTHGKPIAQDHYVSYSESL